MSYQKALLQFAFLGVALPLVALFGIYYFYQDLQDSVAEHQALYTKLTSIAGDIATTQKKVATYQLHKPDLERIQTQKLRTFIPTLFPLLSFYGLNKDVLQFRLGFGEENAGISSMKQFSNASINVQLVGRYIPLLQSVFAIEQASPSLFVLSFSLSNNAPTSQRGQIDQPLSLNLNYGALNIPAIP